MNHKAKGSDKWVAKRNELINAFYSLTVYEHRLINYGISLIDRNDIFRENIAVSFDLDEFREFFGLDEGRNSNAVIIKSIESLYKKEINFRDNGKSGTRWLTGRSRVPVNNKIKFSFNGDLSKYLTGLSNNYTMMLLNVTKDFKSQYSFKMYERLALERFKKKESISLSVEEIRKILNLEDKYPAWAQLNQRVIKPVIADLQACTLLDVEVFIDKERVGRHNVVTGITITYIEDKKAQPPKAKPKSNKVRNITDAMIKKHAKPGETEFDVRNRLNK